MKSHIALFIMMFIFSSSISAEQLGDLSEKQLIEMQSQNNALIIDIRTAKEWQTTGIIPGAKKLEFFSSTGSFNTEKWLTEMEQFKSSSEQPVILVCRSGYRTEKVGKMLSEKLGIKNVFHLSKGISSWIAKGYKIEQ